MNCSEFVFFYSVPCSLDIAHATSFINPAIKKYSKVKLCVSLVITIPCICFCLYYLTSSFRYI